MLGPKRLGRNKRQTRNEEKVWRRLLVQSAADPAAIPNGNVCIWFEYLFTNVCL
jgi:hypothetical protein